MNSRSREGESVVEDDWSEGMSESSRRWGLSGLCWTRIAAWRSAVEVHGDCETAMGKDFGGAGGGGRQGEVECCDCGDE